MASRPLRLLLTNVALETPGGSELYLLDMAAWLRDQGHTPVLYSARLGPLAQVIRRQAVPVIDDLSRLAEPPDLIHAQHHMPAMAALARFPHTPAVYFCHGWLPWQEAPLRHPAIRRYVAVSHATRERLVAEHAVPASTVRILPNFVDTRRFQSRGPLPDRPRRALIFSNQASEGGWVAPIRQACGECGIEVELAGRASGRLLDRPEETLGAYDLVFARGRSALEAMAVGCAVILCDEEGLGPMVTSDNFDRLGLGNFGVQVLRDPHRPELFRQAIDTYDPDEAAVVSALVCATRSLDRVAPQVFAVYEEALADHAGAPHDKREADAAAAAYVTLLQREFPEPWLAKREAFARSLRNSEVLNRNLAAEVEHLRGVLADRTEAAEEAALDADARLDAARQASDETITRLTEEVDELRATLARIRTGFLFRRLMTPLWQARLWLLPDDSIRHRAYLRVRAGVDWLIGLGSPARASGAANPAEVAMDVPVDAMLSAVVMDVGSRPETVEAVESLVTQAPRPEVIVVTSGGGDLDEQIARAGHDVTVIQVSGTLMPGGSRNVGLAASEGRSVGFLAGDCLARPGWVAGRLAAHAVGAEAVASAVVNHPRWNPFAAAAHCLLFSRRLPGVAVHRRLHFGASYQRDLFARFGTFRHDLRTNEDAEFHDRMSGQVRFVFRGDVQAAHRNPEALPALLRDQFNRGRRMAHDREDLTGRPARFAVARGSVKRVPQLLWISLASSPMREWGPILWGVPWVLPGAFAYAFGALSAQRRNGTLAQIRSDPGGTPPRTEDGRRRLICVTPFRNERRFIEDFLSNVAPQVDGIVALDDGSSDGSGEIMARHPSVLEVIRIAPREPHHWNELRNRRLLVDAAVRHGADWVIALDADERLECRFRVRLEKILDGAGPDGPRAYAVTFRELWDAPDQYRVDGVWGHKRNARLFRPRPDHDFGSRALHGHWAPENSSGPNGGFVVADLVVYHLRMIQAVDRERRMRRYLKLDPESKWQAIGYEYLVDTVGLEVEKLPPGRGYEPLAQAVTEPADEHLDPVAVAGPGST